MTVPRAIGVALPPLETRREVVLHVASRAERLGYEAFFLAEAWGHDVGVLLTEVATRTSRITLGSGVLSVWGRSPATLAMLATSLQEVSGGRFVLGLGASSPALAEGLHDVPFRAPVQRLRAVTEQTRRLLRGDRIAPSVPGVGRPLRLGVRADPEVPIHLAGLGPASVRLAGELADGWYPFLFPVTRLDDGLALLARGAGTGPLPRVCPGVPVAVAEDPAEARRLAAWWVAFYLTRMGPLYRQTLRHMGYGAEVDAVLAANPTGGTAEVPDAGGTLLEDLTVWGTPDDAREQIDRWYTAGAEMPVLALPPGRSITELDAILEALQPAPPTPPPRCRPAATMPQRSRRTLRT